MAKIGNLIRQTDNDFYSLPFHTVNTLGQSPVPVNAVLMPDSSSWIQFSMDNCSLDVFCWMVDATRTRYALEKDPLNLTGDISSPNFLYFPTEKCFQYLRTFHSHFEVFLSLTRFPKMYDCGRSIRGKICILGAQVTSCCNLREK